MAEEGRPSRDTGDVFPYELSYDPRDPYVDLPGAPPGVRVAVTVFTVDNVYGLDPGRLAWDGDRLVADGLSWAGQQRRSDGRVELAVEQVEGGVQVRVAAEHAEAIKSVKLLFRGLPEAALERGWWQMTSPEGTSVEVRPGGQLLWRYPWPEGDAWPEWETPFAVAGDRVCVSVRDPEVRPVRLFVHRPPWVDGGHVVEVVCEDDARRWAPGRRFEAPPVRLFLADGPAALDAECARHLAWVEAAHGLVPFADRTDVPAWVDDLRLVVTLHGQHWTGYVFNTFDRMVDALRLVCEEVPGPEVLAYLPGWEGRYYRSYPRYAPGPDLGGAAGFDRLRSVAADLGVHLMPMFGMHGVHVAQYPDWERAAFRSRSDRRVVGVNEPDWDGDRAPEDDQVFCNPGESAFRAHLAAEVRRLLDDHPVDGVFLDTSACWFNDPRANLVEGYRTLLTDLRDTHPDVLFAGEGWFDALLALFPVNQSWLGTDRAMRVPELMTRFARGLGHLSAPAPGSGSTGVHENGWGTPSAVAAVAGHVATVSVVDDTLTDHADALRAACRAAVG
jgi:hypothetical protein